jgi:hypothetical protein
MARVITKELAVKIAAKLKAVDESKPNAPHENWCVYHNGQLVVHFGIRRGSSWDQGHDHVQKALNVTTGFAKELAICTKSREDYLRAAGHLPALPEPEPKPKPE